MFYAGKDDRHDDDEDCVYPDGLGSSYPIEREGDAVVMMVCCPSACVFNESHTRKYKGRISGNENNCLYIAKAECVVSGRKIIIIWNGGEDVEDV